MKRDPGFGLEYVITSFTVFGNGCLGRYLMLPPLPRDARVAAAAGASTSCCQMISVC